MNKETLPTDFQHYIALSRYSRWIEDLNRRETWEETVSRYVENVVRPVLPKGSKSVAEEVAQAIQNLEVMPSMRGLMAAGEAINRDNMALFNCSFIAVDHPRAFDEVLYILTCGTGVGFSCETQYVNKLPDVAESFHKTDTTIVVGDSRIGWASAFRELIQLLYAGKVPKIDVTRVRGKGERLKTFGGRASGPQPLVDLFDYCVHIFEAAKGRKLTDIEVHGILCKIGEVVVVGGVRRSALISLSDLSSARMSSAKSGSWWDKHPEYALANNSAVYTEKPTVGQFLEEWTSLYESQSGERGIYYRKGIRDKIEAKGKRDASLVIGTNPCSEIALRSAGLCNLSEVVVRAEDTLDDLKRKVRIATIIGTVQSTYTNFRYVRSVWKKNAEEERLLGVSLTGILDHPVLGVPSPELEQWLTEMGEYSEEVNKEWAAKLGINEAAAIRCVKPSGTVSQLVNSASGIHPRHSQYYIRSVRQDSKDPLTALLIDQGVPHEPCVMKPDTTVVFYFPVKAPETARTREELTATQHLDLWEVYNRVWADHQVSITVSLREPEWVGAAAWVYNNFDGLSGISFLPYDGGTYKQAPYQTVTKEEYEEFLAKMPEAIDWDKLQEFELYDTTTSSQTLACTSGACELVL